jgi:RNA polymerase sigma factor (TIGR02999 family)
LAQNRSRGEKFHRGRNCTIESQEFWITLCYNFAVSGLQDITVMLGEARLGDSEALDHLIPILNAELHRIARSCLRRERPDHTLQPTALIHEAYIRLLKGAQPDWQSRTHFFSVAARIMRQILTDHARVRAAAKRGWNANVSLEHAAALAPQTPSELIALDDALQALGIIDERKSRVIELRYFGGLEMEEISSVLDISIATVRRDLRMGEAWLRREMTAPAGQASA